MTIKEVQKLCLSRGIPFYTYRLPGGQEVFFGAQLSGQVLPDRELSHCSNDGFVVVPFEESEEVPELFIREDVGFVDETMDDRIIKALETAGSEFKKLEPGKSISREEYLKQAEDVVTLLKEKEAQKVVLARRKVVSYAAYKRAPKCFQKLLDRYPDTFVFLVSVPGVMTWMGATPEVFLRQMMGFSSTMSLAGTRAAGTGGEWGEKEKKEQEIVTDYIAEVLERLVGIGWWQHGPFSRRAGKLEHLCTTFSYPGRLPDEMIDVIRKELHPTPAVGGYPKLDAREVIHRIEGKNRRYYGGYLGPVHKNWTFDWFVNLRSMELFPNAACLYVGGGLTVDSVPELEWKETVLKSKTLLSII